MPSPARSRSAALSCRTHDHVGRPLRYHRKHPACCGRRLVGSREGWFQPSCCQVQPPVISNAFAPARLTVSGPVKLLLSMMLLVSVLARVAS
jgi:hypothetical protein